LCKYPNMKSIDCKKLKFSVHIVVGVNGVMICISKRKNIKLW
jgi:hypothetical protein